MSAGSPSSPGQSVHILGGDEGCRGGHARAIGRAAVPRAPFEKLVKLSTEWQRYSLEFTPTAEVCYVLAGPDLGKSEDNPNPPARATVWLDAVQLAPSEVKTFATRQPVELGVGTAKPGNIFAWDEPLQMRLTVASAEKEARKADIELVLDRLLRRGGLARRQIGDGAGRLVAGLDGHRSGFAQAPRLSAAARHDDQRNDGGQADSAAGVDPRLHADGFAFRHEPCLRLARNAHALQEGRHRLDARLVDEMAGSAAQEKGPFDFTETDAQIDRQLRRI